MVHEGEAGLEAEEARHPMAELVLNMQGGTFVPNDVKLSKDDTR